MDQWIEVYKHVLYPAVTAAVGWWVGRNSRREAKRRDARRTLLEYRELLAVDAKLLRELVFSDLWGRKLSSEEIDGLQGTPNPSRAFEVYSSGLHVLKYENGRVVYRAGSRWIVQLVGRTIVVSRMATTGIVALVMLGFTAAWTSVDIANDAAVVAAVTTGTVTDWPAFAFAIERGLVVAVLLYAGFAFLHVLLSTPSSKEIADTFGDVPLEAGNGARRFRKARSS